MRMKAKGMKKGGASKVPAKKITMKKTYFDMTDLPEAERKEMEKMLRSLTGAAMTKKELEAAMKNIGSGIAKDVDSSLSKKDSKKLRDRMKKAQTKKKGGAMKTKGGNRGGVKRNMRPPSSTKSGLYGR